MINHAALIAKSIKDESHIYQRTLDVIDDTVRKELSDLTDQARELHEGDEHYDLGIDIISDEAWKIQDRIYPALYRGVLLSLYADIEDCLLALCGGYAAARSVGDVEEMKRWGIWEAKNFLKNEVAVQVPDQSGAWQELTEFKRLRDCLAHRNGRLSSEEQGGALV